MARVQVLPTHSVREITVSHLRLFLDATTDLAPTTLARRKAALRSCFRWAYQQDLVPADPTAKLEAIPIGERDPRPLTEKQVEAFGRYPPPGVAQPPAVHAAVRNGHAGGGGAGFAGTARAPQRP